MKLTPRLAAFAAAYTDALHARSKNPTPPELPASPDFLRPNNANYAHHAHTKKSSIAHFPTSQDRSTAFNIIRWCMAVAQLPADSPRFAYYVSRWDVPNKVARAIADGSYDDAVSNCPPIDPAWVRFVPAALEAHRQFIAAHARPKADKAKS